MKIKITKFKKRLKKIFSLNEPFFGGITAKEGFEGQDSEQQTFRKEQFTEAQKMLIYKLDRETKQRMNDHRY